MQVRFTIDMEHISFDESLVVFISELVFPCMNTCLLFLSLQENTDARHINFQWQAKFPSYYLSTITAQDEQGLSLGRLMSGIYAHFYRVLYAY